MLRRHAEVTASLDGAPGLTVLRDLTYGRRSAERFDLVVPSGSGPYPAVLWFHGGFWQEGSKEGSGFAAPALAQAGIALAGVGYPLTPDVRLRAIVQSAGAALVRLQNEAPSYGLDPQRIVVAGHSAGAHLAAAIVAGMAGEAAASAARGAVLVSGVYDLAPVAASYVNDLAHLDIPADARKRITEAMDSPRYLAILAVLRSWRTAPPVDPETSTAKLVKRARKAQRKADCRLVAALDVDDSDAALLHRARKAAKRARYAAELCQDIGGSKQTKRTVKHYKRFQSILGDHQDTVVAADLLRRMALASGTTAGENGFTFGLLYGREQRIADDCRRQAREML